MPKGQDAVLNGIKPCNPQPDQAKKSKTKRAPTRSTKQDAVARNQGPQRNREHSELFGHESISRDVIESQFGKNKGAFHPDNVECVSLEELQDNAERLLKHKKPEPFPPTPQDLFTDRPKAPHTFLLELGYNMRSQNEVNQVELEQKRVGINKFGTACWQKVVEGRKYNAGRRAAYAAYFRYLADVFDAAEDQCKKYENERKMWLTGDKLITDAVELAGKQAAYEAALLDTDRRSLLQEQKLTDIEASLSEGRIAQLVEERLKAMGISPEGNSIG